MDDEVDSIGVGNADLERSSRRGRGRRASRGHRRRRLGSGCGRREACRRSVTPCLRALRRTTGSIPSSYLGWARCVDGPRRLVPPAYEPVRSHEVRLPPWARKFPRGPHCRERWGTPIHRSDCGPCASVIVSGRSARTRLSRRRVRQFLAWQDRDIAWPWAGMQAEASRHRASPTGTSVTMHHVVLAARSGMPRARLCAPKP